MELGNERFRLEMVVFLEEGGKGGIILQIPNLEASFSILKMYAIGSSNSAGVGRYSGATGMDFNHGNTSPFDSAMVTLCCDC